jgi:ferredoxin-type protein NapH
MSKYRKWIQALTLIIFGALVFLGKMKLWMMVFFASLFLSSIAGRFYCGYLCPINTCMEVIDENAAKKGKKRRKTPSWLKNDYIRISILVVFLVIMGFVFATGKKLPVLVILFFLGLIVTIFYEPSLWHRYLCPYGTLLAFFSAYNKKGYEIDKRKCIKCGICVKVCQADAVNWPKQNQFPEIQKNLCLVCGKCEKACPQEAISFTSNTKSKKRNINDVTSKCP